MTVIHSCTCVHEFQDKKYGKGMRVCNTTLKNNSTVVRCTVCGKEYGK